MDVRHSTELRASQNQLNHLDLSTMQGSEKFVACRAILRMAAAMPNAADMQARAAEATRILVGATRNTVQDLSAAPQTQRPDASQVQEALANARALAQFAPTAERRSLGHYMAIKLVGRQDALEHGTTANIPYVQIPQGPHGHPLLATATVTQKTKQPSYRKSVDVAGGAHYDMADVTHNGTFGQVRFAQRTQAGKSQGDFAIKVQRNHSKIGPSGARTVVFREMSEITAEVTKAITAPNKIERLLAKWGFFGITEKNPFAAVRGANAPVAVLDAFVDDKAKVHMAMFAFDGSLLELRRGMQLLSPDVKRAVADSVAAQAFTELEALHHGRPLSGKALAHRDLKLDNIVFSGQGAVKLIDFDTVLPTFYKGLPKTEGKAGTTVSPEMIGGGKLRLGLANDVWAMSASIFELFQPSDAKPSPFLTADIRSAAGRAGAAQADFFRAFASWRKLALQNDSLHVDDAAFAALVLDPALIAAKARLDEFFAPAVQAHPELSRMLLQQGMNTSPQRRNTARNIARELRQNLPSIGHALAGSVRNFFAEAARDSVKAAKLAELSS